MFINHLAVWHVKDEIPKPSTSLCNDCEAIDQILLIKSHLTNRQSLQTVCILQYIISDATAAFFMTLCYTYDASLYMNEFKENAPSSESADCNENGKA